MIVLQRISSCALQIPSVWTGASVDRWVAPSQACVSVKLPLEDLPVLKLLQTTQSLVRAERRIHFHLYNPELCAEKHFYLFFHNKTNLSWWWFWSLSAKRVHTKQMSTCFVTWWSNAFCDITFSGGGACELGQRECLNGGWCARQLSTGRTFCHCAPDFFGTLCESSLNPDTVFSPAIANDNLGISILGHGRAH